PVALRGRVFADQFTELFEEPLDPGRGHDAQHPARFVPRVAERVADAPRTVHEHTGRSLVYRAVELDLELAFDDVERFVGVFVDVEERALAGRDAHLVEGVQAAGVRTPEQEPRGLLTAPGDRLDIVQADDRSRHHCHRMSSWQAFRGRSVDTLRPPVWRGYGGPPGVRTSRRRRR